MSNFVKFSNRFFMFGKKSKNLKIFLLEREFFHEIDLISIQIFKKSRVLEKKLSSFEKFPNRFFMLGKKSQNLKNFFLERELFHEIDHDFRIIGRNVMFWHPRRELKGGR